MSTMRESACSGSLVSSCIPYAPTIVSLLENLYGYLQSCTMLFSSYRRDAAACLRPRTQYWYAKCGSPRRVAVAACRIKDILLFRRARTRDCSQHRPVQQLGESLWSANILV